MDKIGEWLHTASLLLSLDSHYQVQRRREHGGDPRLQAGQVEGRWRGRSPHSALQGEGTSRPGQGLGQGREAVDGTASPAQGGCLQGAGRGPWGWSTAPDSLWGGSKRQPCNHCRKPALSPPAGSPLTAASGHWDLPRPGTCSTPSMGPSPSPHGPHCRETPATNQSDHFSSYLPCTMRSFKGKSLPNY